MTRKDLARIFRVSETLEVTDHWRVKTIIGDKRIVTRIDKTHVRMHEPGVGPADLVYTNATYVERDNGSIRVEWENGRYISYRILDAR